MHKRKSRENFELKYAAWMPSRRIGMAGWFAAWIMLFYVMVLRVLLTMVSSHRRVEMKDCLDEVLDMDLSSVVGDSKSFSCRESQNPRVSLHC